MQDTETAVLLGFPIVVQHETALNPDAPSLLQSVVFPKTFIGTGHHPECRDLWLGGVCIWQLKLQWYPDPSRLRT